MSLDPDRFTGALYSAMASRGWVGPQLMNFCKSVAYGSVSHVVGKPFTSTPSTTGPDTGISGYDESSCRDTIYAQCGLLFGSFGPRLYEFCEAVAEGFVAEFAEATLLAGGGDPTKPFGDLVVGSIGVDALGWGGLITTTGVGYGMLGSHWPLMSQAIGTGGVAGMATATGKSVSNGTGSVT